MWAARSRVIGIREVTSEIVSAKEIVVGIVGARVREVEEAVWVGGGAAAMAARHSK